MKFVKVGNVRTEVYVVYLTELWFEYSSGKGSNLQNFI